MSERPPAPGTDRRTAPLVAPVWDERPGPRPGRSRRHAALVPRVVPFAVAALLWWLGAAVPAAVVAALSLLLLVASRIRPSSVARVDAVLGRVGRAAGHALSTVLLGLVSVCVFLPVALLARLLRRDLLTDRGDRAPGRWRERPGDSPVARRPFALEPARRRGLTAALAVGTVRVVGALTILALLDYGLGWVWDDRYGTHEPPVDEPVSAQTVAELTAAPAMADQEWAASYWQEIRSLDYEFQPFILSRVRPFAGRHIQVEGPVRRSYEPTVRGGEEVPEVWFLGGSALWGEGQRDEHTIPSEVARLAEADGRPVRVMNLGQPGYTSWQSALLLEQQLAVAEAPDLVVVYDGAADVAVQLERASVDPTHFNVRGLDTALTGRDSARDQVEDWWESYRDTSVVNRLVERIEGLVSEPASADAGEGLEERVADLRARSMDLAAFAAGHHDVPVVFAVQAGSGVAGDGGAFRDLTVPTAPPGTRGADLRAVLDDVEVPVYLDGVLTNEAGAAVVARELWPLVRAELD